MDLFRSQGDEFQSASFDPATGKGCIMRGYRYVAGVIYFTDMVTVETDTQRQEVLRLVRLHMADDGRIG